MSMYIPEFKEEVSENAKILVMEEDGRVYRTEKSRSDFYYINYKYTDDGCVITSYDDEIFDLSTEELLCNVISRRELEDGIYQLLRVINVINEFGEDFITDGECSFGIDKADRTIFID